MSAWNAYYGHVHTLKPSVLKHLPSIEWLVSTRDEDRRTGRTTALALAFLRDSFSSPYRTQVFDHQAPDHGVTKLIRSKIREMYEDIEIDRFGIIAAQPFHPSDPSHPKFHETLANIEGDFVDICRSAAKIGVDPEWMLEQVKTALAESVMSI